MAEDDSGKSDAVVAAISDLVEGVGREHLPASYRVALARILDALAASVKHGSFEVTFHAGAVADIVLKTRERPKR